MACQPHAKHDHKHAAGCGHPQVLHRDHKDTLHDGHLHHQHGDHVDDHRLEVGSPNPDACAPGHRCGAHDAAHKHGTGCGHPSIPHGEHVDHWVQGHLHRAHGDHCDDHGPLKQG
jgi:hypothetical protein